MSINIKYLKQFGPVVATFGYAFGKEKTYKVGDSILGNTVIKKTEKGDSVCASRSKALCSACVASGWAQKYQCEIPLVEN